MAGQKQQQCDYFVHCETNTKSYSVNMELRKILNLYIFWRCLEIIHAQAVSYLIFK